MLSNKKTFNFLYAILSIFASFAFLSCNNLMEDLDGIAKRAALLAAEEAYTGSSYTVEHYWQNVDDDQYFLYESESLTGDKNTLTQAQAKNYTGFSPLAFDQQLILEDESTLIKIYYDRHVWKITYDDGVDDSEISVPDALSVRYGSYIVLDFINVGVRYRCAFTGWNTQADGSGTSYSSSGTTVLVMGDSDVTLYAQWEEGVANYLVRHYQQNINDNDYTEVTEDSQLLYGQIDSLTAASAKSYVGFTALEINQQTILEDSSTEVIVYYDRNIYTISYEDGLDSEEITVPSSQSGRYGAEITLNFTGVGSRGGYNFFGWNTQADGSGTSYTSSENPVLTLAGETVTLYARWIPITYTVRFESNAPSGAAVSGSMDDMTFEYGERKALTANAFTCQGYDFAGWGLNSTTTDADYLDQAQVSNLTPIDGVTIELYAIWTATSSGITVTEPTYSDSSSSLTLTYSIQSNEIIFTGGGSFDSFYWYVDGNLVASSGSSLRVLKSDYSVGNHQLLLYGQSSDGSSMASATLTFNFDITVFVTSASNGSITASNYSASQGDYVSLNINPDQGYRLGSLTATDSDGNSVILLPNTYASLLESGTLTGTTTYSGSDNIEIESTADISKHFYFSETTGGITISPPTTETSPVYYLTIDKTNRNSSNWESAFVVQVTATDQNITVYCNILGDNVQKAQNHGGLKFKFGNTSTSSGTVNLIFLSAAAGSLEFMDNDNGSTDIQVESASINISADPSSKVYDMSSASGSYSDFDSFISAAESSTSGSSFKIANSTSCQFVMPSGTVTITPTFVAE